MIRCRIFSLAVLILLILNTHRVTSVKTDTKKKEPAPSNQDVDTVEGYDPTKIVNRHDFKYIHNPGEAICGKPSNNNSQDDDIYLLVYVHTAPENFRRRQTQRDTWLRRSLFKRIRVVFMMGYVDNKYTRDKLNLESQIYQDIVQEDFMDSYHNLTYKGIMAVKWISEYCTHAKYILKVDDDIVTNVFIVMRHLESLARHNMIKQNQFGLEWEVNIEILLIFMSIIVGLVIRKKGSKWYVSKEEHALDTYGKYCSGSAYILTNDLPKRMYDVSLHVKFFWVDDYYMTGLLLRALNVTYRVFTSLYTINSNLVEQRFAGKTADYTAYGHLPSRYDLLHKTWKNILKNQFNHFPSLVSDSKAKIVKPGDFNYIEDLKWDRSILPPIWDS